MTGNTRGGEWWNTVFRDLTRILSQIGIAPSTLSTYRASWNQRARWRTQVQQASVFSSADDSPDDELAEVLAQHLAYKYFARGNNLSTAVGNLTVVQFSHQKTGVQLPMSHSYIRAG